MADNQSISPPPRSEWWESDFVLDPNVLDGYPSIPELGNFNDNTMDSKYQFSSHVDDLYGYPSLKLGGFHDNTVLSRYTFKLGRDYLQGYPYLQQENIDLSKNFKVYSKYIFLGQDQDDDPLYIDGYPTLGRQDFNMFGCGKDSTLNEIEIPRSVFFIADWAFYNSGVRSVKINRHCIYFAHSFPPGCHIKPYKELEDDD